MIRPVDFKFNEQTAVNNKFQQASSIKNVQQQALTEFDNFVSMLRDNGIEVTVINDTPQPETPDSIFPNNWISFHDNGEVLLYPMFSENRRLERRGEIVDNIRKKFEVNKITDLSHYEHQHLFLEGTGSLVLDRDRKIAYACISLRTSLEVLEDFCSKTGYTPLIFNAFDAAGFPIYHTNVMMCIGERFAVVCFESIPDLAEREKIKQSLNNTGKEVVSISLDQMNHFAGNMLEVQNNKRASLLVMSEQAYLCLNNHQIESLKKYSTLIFAPLNTIESNGGGSARCMLAEIHLKKRM